MRKIILSFALCTLGLCAWATDFWEDQNCYEIIEGTNVRLTSSWKEGELNIPEKVTHDAVEYTVTEIGNGGYVMVSERISTLTSLTIPASVTSVAAYAFATCDNLANIYFMGTTAPACGGEAFRGSDANGWDYIFKHCTITVKTNDCKASFNTADWSYWQCFYNEGNVKLYAFDLWDDYYDDKSWHNGTDVDVTLHRTFEADQWYTLCVPAYLSTEAIESAFGADAQIVELTSSTSSEDHWDLVFTPVTYTVACKPYLIKVTSRVENPVFEGVYFLNTESKEIHTAYANMIGSFEKMNLIPGKYYVSDDNTLYQPASSVEMKGYRAYFTFTSPIPAGVPARVVVSTNQTTDIENQELKANSQKLMKDGQIFILRADGLYTTDGKRVK